MYRGSGGFPVVPGENGKRMKIVFGGREDDAKGIQGKASCHGGGGL